MSSKTMNNKQRGDYIIEKIIGKGGQGNVFKFDKKKKTLPNFFFKEFFIIKIKNKKNHLL